MTFPRSQHQSRGPLILGINLRSYTQKTVDFNQIAFSSSLYQGVIFIFCLSDACTSQKDNGKGYFGQPKVIQTVYNDESRLKIAQATSPMLERLEQLSVTIEVDEDGNSEIKEPCELRVGVRN